MLKNPFIVGREIKYREPFCDREEEIHFLTSRAKSSESICLMGLRRFGKSSLLNQVIGYLETENWVGIKIDLMGIRSIEDFCLAIQHEIDRVEKGLKQKLERVFRDYKPKFTIEIDPLTGFPSLEIGLDTRVFSKEELLLQQTLSRCLELPQKIKRPVLFVFDEFQELRRLSKDGKIEGIIRKIFQQRDFDFVPFYLGSKRNMLQYMFQRESEPFFRSASIKELGEISCESYVKFVKEQFKKTLGFYPTEYLLEIAWKIFRGHPYVLIKAANRLWFAHLEDKKLNEKKIWPEIITSIILEERYFYEALNRNIAPYILKIFTAIAENEPVKNPYQESFLKKINETASRVQKALNLLLKEDKIKRTAEGLFVVDPMERIWILTSRLDEEEIIRNIETLVST